MGYSTSILQNPVCVCDRKKDKWRSKSRAAPSAGLPPWPVGWKHQGAPNSFSSGARMRWSPPASLGSASRDVILNGEVEESTPRKHQRTEAYGVESSWLPSADADQKSFKPRSSSRSLQPWSVPRHPWGVGRGAAGLGRRLLRGPLVCPAYPAGLSYWFIPLSCWMRNAQLLNVDVHSSCQNF